VAGRGEDLRPVRRRRTGHRESPTAAVSVPASPRLCTPTSTRRPRCSLSGGGNPGTRLRQADRDRPLGPGFPRRGDEQGSSGAPLVFCRPRLVVPADRSPCSHHPRGRPWSNDTQHGRLGPVPAVRAQLRTVSLTARPPFAQSVPADSARWVSAELCPREARRISRSAQCILTAACTDSRQSECRESWPGAAGGRLLLVV
jgi:hypothetical protein